MRDVSIQIQLVVIRFNGIRIDRHVFTLVGLEPDDLRVAALAAFDAALMRLGGVLVVEAHATSFLLASHQVVSSSSCSAEIST